MQQLRRAAFVWSRLFAVGFAVAASLAALSARPAAADAMPTNTIMNAFVKVEPKQIDLVVRIPVDLLRGLPFPQKGRQFDLAASEPVMPLAIQLLSNGFVVLENNSPLSPIAARGRLSVDSDRSFEDYESAVAHVDNAPDLNEQILVDQADFDVHLTYPISSPTSLFKIQSQVAADLGGGTKLLVRYMPLGGGSRAFIIPGGSEPMPLNPSWYSAAASFIELGIGHILNGTDHLLFLFCLVIPFRRMRGLFSVITAFTLAHSVTLFASAFHLAPKGAWFPRSWKPQLPLQSSTWRSRISLVRTCGAAGSPPACSAWSTGSVSPTFLPRNCNLPDRISCCRCSHSTSASSSDRCWFWRWYCLSSCCAANSFRSERLSSRFLQSALSSPATG